MNIIFAIFNGHHLFSLRKAIHLFINRKKDVSTYNKNLECLFSIYTCTSSREPRSGRTTYRTDYFVILPTVPKMSGKNWSSVIFIIFLPRSSSSVAVVNANFMHSLYLSQFNKKAECCRDDKAFLRITFSSYSTVKTGYLITRMALFNLDIVSSL